MVRACIVSFDFSLHKCSSVEVKEYNRVFSFQFVFREYIFDPCQWLNGDCRSTLIVRMYMQHIPKAIHIWTFYWIFIIVKTHALISNGPFEMNYWKRLRKNSFLTMHQAKHTIIFCKSTHRRIHVHHLPKTFLVKPSMLIVTFLDYHFRPKTFF